MDLIILILLIAIVLFWFKDFTCFVYFIGIVEIFFRIMAFIKTHIGIAEIADVIGKYVPGSILEIFARYSDGLFYDLLCWGFVICFGLLEFYLVKYFIKRK